MIWVMFTVSCHRLLKGTLVLHILCVFTYRYRHTYRMVTVATYCIYGICHRQWYVYISSLLVRVLLLRLPCLALPSVASSQQTREGSRRKEHVRPSRVWKMFVRWSTVPDLTDRGIPGIFCLVYSNPKRNSKELLFSQYNSYLLYLSLGSPIHKHIRPSAPRPLLSETCSIRQLCRSFTALHCSKKFGIGV